jgi:hypothetical protein
MASRFADRFDGLPPRACAGILLALLLTICACMVAAPSIPQIETPIPRGVQDYKITDNDLYSRIIDGVARGGNYYEVATRLQRENGFPLKPFVTVRSPVLAWLSATLGPVLMRVAMLALIGSVLVFAIRAQFTGVPGPMSGLSALGILGVSVIPLSLSAQMLFHESWAALLMALSLALRSADRFKLSVAIGLAAVLFRDLALPFLLLMGLLAAWERRWPEARAWLLAIALAVAAYAGHALSVAAFVLPDDGHSPGWTGLGGLPLLMMSLSRTSMLLGAPGWLAGLLLPLSLLGWIGWKNPCGLRITGLWLGYAAMLMLFARPATFYWALLITPIQLTGLAFAPSAINSLIRGCWPGFVWLPSHRATAKAV